MATLTFTFETGDVPLSRIIDAFAGLNGYVPGDETKEQFARRMVGKRIEDMVRQYETALAIATAQASVLPITLT